MNRQAIKKPAITDNDRFGMTFFLAAIFHGIIILGVTFTVSPLADNKTPPALDVILVQTQTPVEVEDADFLAQVSQQGGDDAEKKARPRELFSAPTLADKPGISAQTNPSQVHRQKQNEQLALITQKNADYAINTRETLKTEEDDNITDKTNAPQNILTARRAAEISHIIENQASMDRVKYLNSSTKEFTPAQYMREWINHVERIGNLNYPDQARRDKLSGTLILDVVISAEGKLIKTDLRQSSGHQILDDAAKRIVKLAAPFSAFSEKLRAEADVIHITRSWEFLSNSSIRTH